jgi:hypothetical protein
VIPYDPSTTALFTPSARETVFEQGKQYSALQLALEAARLAYVRFEESPRHFDRLADALARAGFATPAAFVDAQSDTQGFAACRAADKTALISFRGTQADKLGDVVTDLKAFTVPWTESGGRAHAGFASGARIVMPQIVKWLDNECADRTTLILTGHSLGAALATLVASVCRPTDLITIGSPRVGNEEFTRAFADMRCTRIVDCCDTVTRVPPEPFFKHICPPLYVTRDAETREAPDDEFINKDRKAARRAYFREHAIKPGNVTLRDLADHAPINYIRAFF